MSNPPTVQDPREALRRHFGFPTFMGGQEEAIRQALAGRDELVIMPTGAGKSLCYQLPALMLDGLTVVVSPLIALMKDQVDALEARGIAATAINSSIAPDETGRRLDGLRAGAYKLVYVAPERFRNRRFMETFDALNVPLFAVDEAHCISQWGHDFRPDYLHLRRVLERRPKTRIMALTATATPHVRNDIVAQLGLGEAGRQEPVVLVMGFARLNLKLAVRNTATHADKLGCIQAVLRQYPTGIVYCSTRRQTERVHALLAKAGQPCGCYHGGMTDEERAATQDRFMGGAMPIVAATNAFGMGVDRADLRFVIHWDVPGSIEAYYQEIGRAGRDGAPSACELLYNYADVRTQEFFLQGANPSREQIERVWNTVRAECLHGPVTRPITEWTAQMRGLRNEMAVQTAMAMFERAGLVAREMLPGQNTYTTSIVPGADLDRLEGQFEHLDEKRRNDERKLKDMLRYVGTPGCRHAYVLNYFGERDFKPPCGACDRCVQVERPGTREPTEEEWLAVQKALSCLARMNGRFGIRRVAQVLVGSRAKPVTERGLDRLPTHGLLKPCGEAYVRKLLDELTTDGSIRIVQGEYPLAEITERGRRVMWRKELPNIVWPQARAGRPAPAAPPEPASTLAADAETEAACPPERFEQLKAWRIAMAKRRHIHAYMVLHDKTLKAIAARRPATLAELEEISGIGPSKIAKYGDELLEIVDAWR